MKIHSSLEINIKEISKSFMKDGLVLVDDTGTPTIEQFEEIEYAMLDEIGNNADAYPTEIDEHETPYGTIFIIRNPDRIPEAQASRFLNRVISAK